MGEFKTVKLAQFEWTVKNLAVTVDREGNELVYGVDYRYPNDDESLVEEYGLLYSNEVCNRIPPDGWRLPTLSEYIIYLCDYIGEYYRWGRARKNVGKALASKEGWMAPAGIGCPTANIGVNPKKNNASGFNALPAGCCSGGKARNLGKYALFWTRAVNYEQQRYYVFLDHCSSELYNLTDRIGDMFCSIRLIRD